MPPRGFKATADPPHTKLDELAIILDGARLAEELAKSGLLDDLAGKLAALNNRLPDGVKASPEQLQALVANLIAQYSDSVLRAVTLSVLADVVKLAQTGKGPVFHSPTALS